MHTFWIIVGVLAVLIVLAILIKSKACGGCCDCCGDCDCCCECGECCTVSSLPMFVLGVIALWGGGLTAIGLLVYSAMRG